VRILRGFLVFGLTFLGTLLVLDLYLQVAEIQSPMETRIDPELGPTWIPNKHLSRYGEGFFIGAVNSFGYMGPAIPPRRVGKEKRILLLGDSFVLAHGVFTRHYFGRYLEEGLSRATGEEICTLNFGKADFNLGNMYQYYKDFAGAFDHDLALFFVGEGDFISTGQPVSDLWPRVELVGDTIVIDKGFRLGKTYRFYKTIEPVFTHSAVLRLVFNTYKIMSKINGKSWIPLVFGKFASAFGPQGEQAAGLPAESGELSALSRAILRELAKDPRNKLVFKEPVAPGLVAEIQASGIPVIDLGSFLESLRKDGNDPFYWPVENVRGHWNHAAHRLIGRFLSDQIISGKMLGPANDRQGN
jgi:hypothetical protein